MSTATSTSTRNPTLRRILREAQDLSTSPSTHIHAAPLESDLFEWHFTLLGPPPPSPFAQGIYHGRIILPPAYPLKPPSFRFLTPSGRFEVNREICLSISGHHEETWQPAWGVRTALVAIRSFMETDAKGQLGGMDASAEVRKRLAAQSRAWKCSSCQKTNEEIMREQEEAVKDKGEEGGKKEEEDVVPEGLRLAYREELEGKEKVEKVGGESNGMPPESIANPPAVAGAESALPNGSVDAQPSRAAQTPPIPIQAIRVQGQDVPPWIDKAIYGVVAALLFLVWKKLGS